MTDLDIPDHIRERTEGLFWIHPPTNPKVLLDTAEWWYDNGKGANDPIFHLALGWTMAVHCETYSQVDLMDVNREAREYADDLGLDTSGKEKGNSVMGSQP